MHRLTSTIAISKSTWKWCEYQSVNYILSSFIGNRFTFIYLLFHCVCFECTTPPHARWWSWQCILRKLIFGSINNEQHTHTHTRTHRHSQTNRHRKENDRSTTDRTNQSIRPIDRLHHRNQAVHTSCWWWPSRTPVITLAWEHSISEPLFVCNAPLPLDR